MEASQRNNKLSGALWMDLDHPDFTLALRWCNFSKLIFFTWFDNSQFGRAWASETFWHFVRSVFIFIFFTHSTHHMNMYHQVFKFLNLVCVYIHWQNNKSQFWNQTPPPIPKKKKKVYLHVWNLCRSKD